MDDFVISNLNEARNEWCARLVSIFTPLIIDGIRSIFNESWKMCHENDEVNKYLMTFQNLLSRVPKWNTVIIEEERKRIVERSGCNYLEDLITCVHIIQLKVLTSIRVGNKQKKIDITIPKLDAFIHKVYIHVARKVYVNVYLFEKTALPLQVQKHNRELELIVQECILMAIRESIPTESIIRAYMDESVEQEEEVIIEDIPEEKPVIESVVGLNSDENESEKIKEMAELLEKNKEEAPVLVPTIKDLNEEKVVTRLSFNDYDSVLDDDNQRNTVSAPKSIERLEEISTSRAIQRKLEEEEEDSDKIVIHTDNIELNNLDVMNLGANEKKPAIEDILLDNVEELF
jgi:hypothetical protein